MMALEPHGTDVWVGSGPRYPWGGLYGGQIVAQGLRAGTLSVDDRYRVHSIHAYFIRSGDHTEPIRFEVDRVRNGRSFCTRRITARQSVGVILNMTASYQVDEPGPKVQTAVTGAPFGRPSDRIATSWRRADCASGPRFARSCPELPPADELPEESWSEMFERRIPPRRRGLVAGWMRLSQAIGDDPALQACALAYLSDDLPVEAVVTLHPDWDRDSPPEGQFFSASLDHAIWFHRPIDVDDWHVQTFMCDGLMGSRGVSLGHVFSGDGTHVATVSQEVLLRPKRS